MTGAPHSTGADAHHPAGATARRPPGSAVRLAAPTPAAVRADARGAPTAVGGVRVEAVREEWVVEDRWWTSRSLRRRYFEVVLDDGRDVVVFRDAVGRRWFSQRA